MGSEMCIRDRSRLKIGDMIPTELYEVVAEILVFVNDLDNLKAKIDQR